MKQDKVNDTLDSIRFLMENSTRLMSLNGTAAIFVGIYACITAVAAHYFMAADSHQFMSTLEVCSPARYRLLFLMAAILITISIITVIILSLKRSRKIGQKLELNKLTRRTLWNFFMPLGVGAILCLILFNQGFWGITSSLMLIFYGLALVNVSGYTHSDSKYLGYAQITLGLIDAYVAGHALIFWVIGFGIFHIIYGIWFSVKK